MPRSPITWKKEKSRFSFSFSRPPFISFHNNEGPRIWSLDPPIISLMLPTSGWSRTIFNKARASGQVKVGNESNLL